MKDQEFQIAEPYRKKEFRSLRVTENSLEVTAKKTWFKIPLEDVILISEGDRRLVDFTAGNGSMRTRHPN